MTQIILAEYGLDDEYFVLPQYKDLTSTSFPIVIPLTPKIEPSSHSISQIKLPGYVLSEKKRSGDGLVRRISK